MTTNQKGNHTILRNSWSSNQDDGYNDQDNGDNDQGSEDWNMSTRPITPRATALGHRATSGGRRVVTMGWHPDTPDHRDISVKRTKEQKSSQRSNIPGNNKASSRENNFLGRVNKHLPKLLAEDKLDPTHYDNIAYCSPIEDQGQIGSCTAQAVVGMMEFIMRRHGDSHIDGSRLFLYKVTRQLMGLTGDTGAYLRTAMKAAASIGVPPEKYWEYDTERFDEEPSSFVYTYATNFKAMDYARLDAPGLAEEDLLELLKRTLANGHCAVFGFTVFSSLSEKPDIPFPGEQDKSDGGHAVMAVGYDNNRVNVGTPNKGALVIRNSWGTNWGVNGYGYLPYDYIRAGLARDFWAGFAWDWFENVEGE